MTAAETPERARRSLPGLVLVGPALLLGLVVAAQVTTQAGRSPASSRYALSLAEAATQLQREQESLRAQLADLRARLDGIQGQTTRLDEQTKSALRAVDALKADVGLVAMSGDGVVVTLDDARLPATTARRNLELGIVHSTDITDVLNVAWKAGARAIAVNGERITGASACVGAVIQINGALLSPPFVVTVLGPADRLLAVLGDPAELPDLKQRRDRFGLGLQIARGDSLGVPAYDGPMRVRFAAPR